MPFYAVYERLRDARTVTDYEVAKRTGLRRNIFTEWKTGRSNPKHDKIVKIAAYFGVPASLFYTELDSTPPAASDNA